MVVPSHPGLVGGHISDKISSHFLAFGIGIFETSGVSEVPSFGIEIRDFPHGVSRVEFNPRARGRKDIDRKR